VYEGLTLTSKAAQFLADNVSRVTSFNETELRAQILPSRPLDIPRGLSDTAPHALESLSRGFQAANYKVVIIPYREYRRSGAKGVVTSVLKGIPVAIAAPASGAAEALSFALLGARNSLRPDICKEEEANLRGLHHDR
jgi:autophagy-related protein 2